MVERQAYYLQGTSSTTHSAHTDLYIFGETEVTWQTSGKTKITLLYLVITKVSVEQRDTNQVPQVWKRLVIPCVSYSKHSARAAWFANFMTNYANTPESLLLTAFPGPGIHNPTVPVASKPAPFSSISPPARGQSGRLGPAPTHLLTSPPPVPTSRQTAVCEVPYCL